LNYSEIKYCDIANGVGPRTSVFVSGCSIHCEGCFNSVAWDFDSGEKMTDEVLAGILESLSQPYIEGLSILGGEPLHPKNLGGVCQIMMRVRRRYGDSKTIWLWTGYVYEELSDDQLAIANLADVVVDGPFVISKRDIMLRFRGSSNQRIIDVRKTVEAGHVVLWEDEPQFSTHKWVGHD
jgi:anaerobic ribonucleoside-triphosphate reductase activating protein